jgi:uncharacterized membrane protein
MATPKRTKSSFPIVILDLRTINEPAVVLLGYIALAIAGSFANQTSLQIGLAIMLTFLGSGLSTVAVMFPRLHDLNVIERVALGACLSMTLGGLLGFALARSPWGLRLWPLLITTGLYNIVCYALTWYRRRNLRDDERIIRLDSGRLSTLWHNSSNTIHRIITAVLMISLLSGAWFLVRSFQFPAIDPPMTEFYLLGKGGQTDTYPSIGHAGETLAITYGITNLENVTASYQVKVSIQGNEVGNSPTVFTRSSETKSSLVEFRVPDSISGLTKVDFVLYRDGKPYRFLYLWIDIANP